MAQQQARAAATDKAYADAREPTARIYNSAIGQSTAVEEAIRKALSGQGATQGQDFARKLAEMGAPSATPQATENTQKWKNVEGVGYALGMNGVSRLISRGAGARDWLEKQPGLARQESEAQLSERLRELASQFADDRGEIEASLPDRIKEIQERMYGQEWQRREYTDKLNADAAERKAALEEAYLKQKALMMQFGQQKELKKLDQQFKAQQAAIDRDLKWQLGQLSADTRIATDNPPKADKVTGPANQKFITVNGKKVKNPNYEGPQSAMTGSNRSAIVGQIKTQILTGGRIRERVAYDPAGADAAVNRAIREELEARGINYGSTEGKAIRRLVFQQINGKRIAGEGQRGGSTYRAPAWGLR